MHEDFTYDIWMATGYSEERVSTTLEVLNQDEEAMVNALYLNARKCKYAGVDKALMLEYGHCVPALKELHKTFQEDLWHVWLVVQMLAR